MIKIELVRFEAQDVITASVAVPEETEAVVVEPETPAEPVCTDRCTNGNHHNDTYRDPSSDYYGKIWNTEIENWEDCGCDCH